MANNFFRNDTHHGRVKRFMYMQHLTEFIERTQAQNQPDNQQGQRHQSVIYDAFAGSGRYGEGWPDRIEEFGSPLIAVRIVIFHFVRLHNLPYQYLRNRQVMHRPCTERVMKIRNEITLPTQEEKDIILNFSENNRFYYNLLVDNLIYFLEFHGINHQLQYHLDGIIRISCTDDNLSFCINVAFSDFQAIQAPAFARNRFLFTFIDPCGYKSIPMSCVQRFLGYQREVLITFMSGPVNRFKGSEAVRRTMTNLFGFGRVEEEGMYERLRDGTLNDCLQIYKDQIVRAAGNLVISFQVNSKRNIRIYDLIFVTYDRNLYRHMKEVMWKGTQRRSELIFSSWRSTRLEFTNKQDSHYVANIICQNFQGRRKITVETIQRFLLDETIFAWQNNMLNILLQQPQVLTVERNGQLWFCFVGEDIDEFLEGLHLLQL